jgi:hypothetical protein
MDATIIWRNGAIEAAGTNVAIPFDARVRDGGDSLHVYPGFIDGYGVWGSVDPPDDQPRPARPGVPGYERAGIQPDRSTLSGFKKERHEFTALQKLGFTSAAIGTRGFFLPGPVDIYHLHGTDTPDFLMEDRIAQKAQFVSSSGAYPNTLMAMMTRLRQLFHDAAALREHQTLYAENPESYSPPERDIVLESLYPVMDRRIPIFFSADNREDIQRVLKLRDELGFDLVLVSAKEAWSLAGELKDAGVPVLASIELPEKPTFMKKDEKKKSPDDDDDPDSESDEDSVEDLPDDDAGVEEEETEAGHEEISEEQQKFRKRQEKAYSDYLRNIRRLTEAGVTVGFSSSGMPASDFNDNLMLLLENGYSETELLELFTINTARILGITLKTGSLEQGRIANFSVRTAPLADENSRVYMIVTTGKLTELPEERNGR